MKFSTDGVGSSPVNKSNPMNMSSPIKGGKESFVELPTQSSEVQTVQLDDFFELLDTKTVQKIMETSEESKSRINQTISQLEYETQGAEAILNSLG